MVMEQFQVESNYLFCWVFNGDIIKFFTVEMKTINRDCIPARVVISLTFLFVKQIQVQA